MKVKNKSTVLEPLISDLKFTFRKIFFPKKAKNILLWGLYKIGILNWKIYEFMNFITKKRKWDFQFIVQISL